MESKRIFRIVLVVGLILLIPFIAMFFTDEVNWAVGDFVIAAILLSGTGIAIEFVRKMIKNKDYRVAIIFGVITLLVLIWAELAVGIFGTPFAGS